MQDSRSRVDLIEDAMREWNRPGTRWPLAVGLLLVAALVSLWLGVATDPAWLHHDGAHYSSTARNLLAGEGLTTDVAYYDPQHRMGELPVPLTDWPPGYPLAIAVVMSIGVDGPSAMFAINYFAFLVCGLLIYRCGRLSEATPLLAAGGAAAWLLFVPIWELARSGGAGAPFAMAVLLSYLCLLRAKRRSALAPTFWLLLAGLAGAFAFSLRYAGLFFIGALALFACIEWMRTRRWAGLLEALPTLGPPVLMLVLIVLRNRRLVGSLFSRPDGYPEPITSLPRDLAWALGQLAGVESQALADVNPWSWAALLGLAAAGCIVAAITARCLWSNLAAASRHPAVYPLAVFLSLTALSFLRDRSYFDPRYMVPAVPFAILTVVWTATRLRGDRFKIVRRLFFVALLGYLCGQLGLVRTLREPDRYYEEARAIREHLSVRIADASLAEHLRGRTNRDRPLFSSHPHALSLLLERPMLGVAIADFSRLELTSEAARELMTRFGAHYLLILPDQFDAERRFNRNLELFAEIERGRIPAWLHCVYRDDGVLLLGVADAAPWPGSASGNCD